MGERWELAGGGRRGEHVPFYLYGWVQPGGGSQAGGGFEQLSGFLGASLAAVQVGLEEGSLFEAERVETVGAGQTV
jgi:hypothetical protein